jgi:hypothetical protein
MVVAKQVKRMRIVRSLPIEGADQRYGSKIWIEAKDRSYGSNRVDNSFSRAFDSRVTSLISSTPDPSESNLFETRGIRSATADRWYDRNLRPGGDRTRQPAGVSDIFVANENIDVFAHLSLFGCDAISNPRVECPKR